MPCLLVPFTMFMLFRMGVFVPKIHFVFSISVFGYIPYIMVRYTIQSVSSCAQNCIEKYSKFPLNLYLIHDINTQNGADWLSFLHIVGNYVLLDALSEIF